MKWNFECESERRDYLHDRVVMHCNGFFGIANWSGLVGPGLPKTGIALDHAAQSGG